MKHNRFILILSIFLLLPNIVFSSAIESPPPDAVTIGPDISELKTLQKALDKVSDGGTIYIKHYSDDYFFDEVVIDKDVSIVGLERNNILPTIKCINPGCKKLITISSPHTLNIKDVNFKSSEDDTIIDSYTSNITLDNVSFSHSIPLVVNNPTDNNPIDITIKNCSFDVKFPYINLTNNNGTISYMNNTFLDDLVKIKNSGLNIEFVNNSFNESGIKIEEESEGSIDIIDNEFIGSLSIIRSNVSNDLYILRNKFLSNKCSVSNYDTKNTLHLNKNWWGSDKGPIDNATNHYSFEGDVDYSNWSIDEDFSGFIDDTIIPDNSNTSLKMSSPDNLTDLIQEDSFIVDLNLEDINNLKGAQIILNYDPELIKVNSKTIDIENATNFIDTSKESEGIAVLDFCLADDVQAISGNIRIGSISFEVINKGNGVISIDDNSKIIFEDNDGNNHELSIDSSTLGYSVILGIGNLSGTVALADGDYIDNLSINLYKEDILVYTTVANTDGLFNIDNLIEGSYTIQICYHGYEKYSKAIEINSGENTQVDISLSKIITVNENRPNNYYGIHRKINYLTTFVGTNSKKIEFNDDLIILVPKGAYPSSTSISIKRLPSKGHNLSDIYKITANNELKDRVKLSFKIDDNLLDKNLGIYYYNEEKATWKYVGGRIEDKYLTAWVSHFSKYTVFDCKQFYKYIDILDEWEMDFFML